MSDLKGVSNGEKAKCAGLLAGIGSRVKVGGRMAHGNVVVLPLYVGDGGPSPYAPLKEALEAGTFVVTEVSEGGSVPTLRAENNGDKAVLILVGDELVGAKQNRIVNITMIVAAHSAVVLPVSCVEAGRWGYRTRRFSAGRRAFTGLLRETSRSVRASVRSRGKYQSDQQRVWGQVDAQLASVGAESPTQAMSAGYERVERDLRAFKETLPYPDGANGLAVFINGKLEALELFSHADILRRVWSESIESHAVEAIGRGEGGGATEAGERPVTEWLGKLSECSEEPRKSVGLGYDVGVESAELVGAALINDDKLVHLMLLGND